MTSNVNTTPAGSQTVRRRPRDRKASIAAIASDMFAARGFNSVRMEDIAAEAGITARALYRHYANKQELLSHIINASQRRFIAAFDAPGDPGASPSGRLDATLARLAAASLASPHFNVLWQREARYLAEDDQRIVRQRLRAMAAQMAKLISENLDELGAEQAQLRAWAVITAVSSPGRHPDLSVPPSRFARLLVTAANAAIHSEPIRPGDGAPLSPAAAGRHVTLPSRREQVLAAATEMFRGAGFQAVNINQIGQRAGIAGPAIYRYFGAKGDILVALIGRYYEWLAYEMVQALRAAKPTQPAEVLARLVEGHARVAAVAPDLVAVAINDWIDLPLDEAEQLQRVRSDYYAAWAEHVLSNDPKRTRAEAMALVRIAITVIEDTVRIARMAARPDFAPAIAAIALGILTARG